MSALPPFPLTRRRFLVASAATLFLTGRARSADEDTLPSIGLCGAIDQASLGKAAGLSFLEIGLKSTCAPTVEESAFDEWIAQVRAASLPTSSANGFIPVEIKLVGPERDLSQLQDYVDASLTRASLAGVKLVTLGSGGARRAPEGMAMPAALEEFTESAREIAKIAQKHGITIAVEPLNREETNLLNRLSDVCTVVDAVNAPNLGATADLYHMHREGEGADAIVAAGARVKHVHIAEDKDRQSPGTAGDDFTSYFSALKTIGYRGELSLECRWNDLAKQLAAAVAEVSAQWRRAA